MSTRLSTEELDGMDASAIRNGAFGLGALRLVAEVRASWKERDAARRALRDLTAAIESEYNTTSVKGQSFGANQHPLKSALDAARAVLSENRSSE